MQEDGNQAARASHVYECYRAEMLRLMRQVRGVDWVGVDSACMSLWPLIQSGSDHRIADVVGVYRAEVGKVLRESDLRIVASLCAAMMEGIEEALYRFPSEE